MSFDYQALAERIKKGGAEKYHQKNLQNHKMFVRDRIKLLIDEGTWVEDHFFAHAHDEKFPADGVVTGLAKVHGVSVAIMANDSTVKAGSWGKRTVEKIIRLQEKAAEHCLPVFYLCDSAGARITDQLDMFPGRRGAGKIFYLQSLLSGKVPQVCVMFGPAAAGGAYVPSFCDVVIMVDENSSMYLGSPRMVEKVIGEKITLNELGGARVHCTTSGCADHLVKTEEEAIAWAKNYFTYATKKVMSSTAPELPADQLQSLIPTQATRTYDVKKVIKTIVDNNSFVELKSLYAKEMVTGFARLEGKTIAILASQTRHKGGVLFPESANKAARFIQLADSYEVPLLFLADVPGFMVGSQVEKQGIIRAGAKMVYALSRATVPKQTVVLRKAYGAGLYAMCGPAFGADDVMALPCANIAVMGAEPAVNAVYYNKIQAMSESEKKEFIAEKIKEYEADINLEILASEMIVDHVVDYPDLRRELSTRYSHYKPRTAKQELFGIMPM